MNPTLLTYYEFLVENFTFVFNKILYVLIILIISVVFYTLITRSIKKFLISTIKTKKQRSNVIVFLNIWRYLFFFIVILMIIFTITGSLTGFGISAGLLTAALGWALQRPITGIAAWIMVVTKKPFQIDDRVIIGDTKGDVCDITLTHVYLNEFGGTTKGEESSGRIIMIPNSLLFEQRIINYTLQDEYILDEVIPAFTYKSNLEIAKKICFDAASKVTKEAIQKTGKKPFLRMTFQPSGIDLSIKYYTLAEKRQEIKSRITELIHKNVSDTKSVSFAYPHTEVILNKK